MKVGIVGLGFVGSAIRDAFVSYYYEDGENLITVDSDPNRASGTYKDLESCDGIFVAVPSPQNSDGSCDTSILESVLKNLKNYDGVIISKVTAPPSVYRQLGKKYKNLVHCPEFLTAANARNDYRNGKFAIIGGNVNAYKNEARRIIEISQTKLDDIHFCSIEEAALAKYVINSFLSTKVIFMNEIYNLSQKEGMDYNLIAEMIGSDPRIGISHMQVPGPDGALGFGGACFPKDTSALFKYAESVGVPLNVLDTVIKKNTILRLTDPK